MKQYKIVAAALMLLMAMLFAAGCKPENDPNNGGGNNSGSHTYTYNGHDCVDLGLPSGTLWATCNVGADTPEGYGDYFAWGETTLKTICDWSTYKYCGGDGGQLTKYCNDSGYGYNGHTDNLTVLQSMDDAATANWGDGWSMPAKAQWEELYHGTTIQWAEQNGHGGLLFTASNGGALFLPAAGYLWYDELIGVEELSNYWSSSLCADNPSNAWEFLSSDYNNMASGRRDLGRSVRPVHSSRQN